jgi:hypothetical protein
MKASLLDDTVSPGKRRVLQSSVRVRHQQGDLARENTVHARRNHQR